MSQQPIGFAPAEITAIVYEPVVARHAEEAAFLWTLRSRAVGAPQYLLADLAALDDRLSAHLDGLTIAGESAWKACEANLATGEGGGEVFALSALAFSLRDRRRMSKALMVALGSDAMKRGFMSALGWLGYDIAGEWVSLLASARSPAHRALGIGAAAIHRRDPGPPLAEALSDPDPELRGRALRAVGEMKRRDLLPLVRQSLKDADGHCRFWSAWSLALHGEPDGRGALADWCDGSDDRVHQAIQVWLRAASADDAQTWLRRMANDPVHLRLAVIGAGIIGLPETVPWLIRRMASPQLARLAGEAFSTITGADLAELDLDQPPPAEDVIDVVSSGPVSVDYESNLPWPSPDAISRWWEARGKSLAAGTRHLCGRPISRATCAWVLREGRQCQRQAAALELTLLDPETMLFETRGRGNFQRRELAAWTS